MIYLHGLTEEEKQTKIKKLEILKNHCKTIFETLTKEEVKNVLTKWQGKVYNKRLETALKNIDKHFYVNTRYGFYLEFNFYDYEERSFYSEFKEQTIYIPNYQHIIRCLTNSALGIDAKIICDDIYMQVLECAKRYKSNYEELEKQIVLIDDFLKQHKEIVDKYNKFESSIDSDILNEFDLYLQKR